MLNIMVKSDQGKKEHSNKVKLGCRKKKKKNRYEKKELGEKSKLSMTKKNVKQ